MAQGEAAWRAWAWHDAASCVRLHVFGRPAPALCGAQLELHTQSRLRGTVEAKQPCICRSNAAHMPCLPCAMGKPTAATASPSFERHEPFHAPKSTGKALERESVAPASPVSIQSCERCPSAALLYISLAYRLWYGSWASPLAYILTALGD